MNPVLGFLKGGGGVTLAVGLIGMAVGAWGAGLWNEAAAAARFREIADRSARAIEQSSGALVTLVQNAGRREMNYLYTLEEQTAACTATVATFQGWSTMSAEERAAAQARAAKLAADNKALSDSYSKLVKSYENADAVVADWLRVDLPPDLCIVRYGAEACRADPFAAAGYPDPPGRARPVAEPPR